MADRTVLIRYIVDVGQAVTAQGQLTASTQATARATGAAMGRAGQSMSTLAKLSSMAGPLIAVGVGGALAVSAKAAIDFESSFAGVRKTVDASEGQFAALAQEMRDLSKEIPVNVNELNKLAEIGGQLGIKAENLGSFTRTIAEIGVATPLAADQAALSLARLSNILGVSQDQIFRIGSSLVELGNNFATTEDQIINFALRIAPVGKTVGLTADQVLAISAAFSSVGVPAERGGTAVQRVFIRMEQAVLSGGGALRNFADIAGVSAAEFADAYENNAARAFQMFIEGLARIQDAGGNVFQVLRDVGLANERSVQSMLAAAGGADQLADALGMSEEAWKDGDSAAEEARKRFQTTEGQMTLTKNAMNDVAISVGESLLPAIASLSEGIRNFVEDDTAQGLLYWLGEFLGLIPTAVSTLSWAGDQIARGFMDVVNFVVDPLSAFTGGPTNDAGKWASSMANAAKYAADFDQAIMQLRHGTGVWAETTEAVGRAELALSQLADQGSLTVGNMKGIQRETRLTDKELLDLGETLMTEGVITLEANGDAWKYLRGEMAKASDTTGYVDRKWGGATKNLEAAAQAAEALADELDNLGDTVLDARGSAMSFVESVRNLKDAQTELTGEANLDNLLAYQQAWNDMRAAGADLEDGIEPLVAGFQEMYKAGVLSREEMERGISEVLRFQQAAAIASENTNAWVLSFGMLQQIAETTGNQLSVVVNAIYGINSAMMNGINAAQIWSDAMSYAASGAFSVAAAYRMMFTQSLEEAELVFNLGQRIRDSLSGLDGAFLDGIQGMVDGASGDVEKTFEELAIEASRKFMDGIRATLNRGAMERALAGAKDALADALEELDELPARIRQLMRELAEAQREASRITMEEEADILRGRLDIMRSERELYELRREQMDIPRQMEEIQEDLTEAQEAYNEALLEAERLENAHKAALTSKQADLFRVQRAYGLGQASFQDVIDAELALARELAQSGDAAEMRQQAEEDWIEAQEEAARRLEDLRYRQQEIALELQLAELELALARKDLTQKMKDAIGPTQEVLKLEEELNELRERAAELRKQMPELEEAVILAELDLIAAHIDLIEYGEALLAMEPRYRSFFESLAAAAGVANGAFRGVVTGGTSKTSVTSASVPKVTTSSYTVQSGDWLSKIANKFGVTLGALINANPQITNPDLIYPGQQVKIPQAHQGAFFDLPRNREFMAMLRGQEMVLDTRQLGAAVAAAVREAGGSGQTIVVQLGDREVARFVSDHVLAEGARRERIARRVS